MHVDDVASPVKFPVLNVLRHVIRFVEAVQSPIGGGDSSKTDAGDMFAMPRYPVSMVSVSLKNN